MHRETHIQRYLSITRNLNHSFVFLLAICLTALVSYTPSTSAQNLSEQLVQPTNSILAWDQAVLHSIILTHAPPTIAARALAIVHTSMFNAWSAYTSDAKSTEEGYPSRRPKDEWTTANKDIAISYAAYRSLVDLFPSAVDDLQSTASAYHVDPYDYSADTSTPQGIGNIAAAAVLLSRHQDGSNQLGDLHPGAYSDYTHYVPVNSPDHIHNPDRWQPLEVRDVNGIISAQTFVTPQWGKVKPFSNSFTGDIDPPISNAIQHEAYVHQAEALIRLSAHLTDEEKIIAEYWALGSGTVTPPGRWFEFAQYVSKRDRHTIDDDVQMFFVLGNAMLDSSIQCWQAKRRFDSERPITAIRYLFKDRLIEAWAGPELGTRFIDGGEWNPYQQSSVITPAFPEHVSGHSTFSSAAADILTIWTGHTAFGARYIAAAGSSVIEPGLTPRETLTLEWPSFRSAADQAGLSRRFGGIHFENGDLDGRRLGRVIARKVWLQAIQFLSAATVENIEHKQGHEE